MSLSGYICGWPTYPVHVFVRIHFVVDLLTRSMSLSGYILWLTYLPGPCLCQDTFCGWPTYPVLVFVRIHFVVDLLTRSLSLSGYILWLTYLPVSLSLSGYILWLTYLPGPCLCQDTFCGWPTYLVLVRIHFVVDLLTRSMSLNRFSSCSSWIFFRFSTCRAWFIACLFLSSINFLVLFSFNSRMRLEKQIQRNSNINKLMHLCIICYAPQNSLWTLLTNNLIYDLLT